MDDTVEIEHRRRQLRERRIELDRRLARIEADLETTPDPDSEERASERENDEVLESLGLSGRNELRAIDAALKRIEEGTYGICVSCHGQISARRLDAVPYTTVCQHCAH